MQWPQASTPAACGISSQPSGLTCSAAAGWLRRLAGAGLAGPWRGATPGTARPAPACPSSLSAGTACMHANSVYLSERAQHCCMCSCVFVWGCRFREVQQSICRLAAAPDRAPLPACCVRRAASVHGVQGLLSCLAAATLLLSTCGTHSTNCSMQDLPCRQAAAPGTPGPSAPPCRTCSRLRRCPASPPGGLRHPPPASGSCRKWKQAIGLHQNECLAMQALHGCFAHCCLLQEAAGGGSRPRVSVVFTDMPALQVDCSSLGSCNVVRLAAYMRYIWAARSGRPQCAARPQPASWSPWRGEPSQRASWQLRAQAAVLCSAAIARVACRYVIRMLQQPRFTCQAGHSRQLGRHAAALLCTTCCAVAHLPRPRPLPRRLKRLVRPLAPAFDLNLFWVPPPCMASNSALGGPTRHGKQVIHALHGTTSCSVEMLLPCCSTSVSSEVQPSSTPAWACHKLMKQGRATHTAGDSSPALQGHPVGRCRHPRSLQVVVGSPSLARRAAWQRQLCTGYGAFARHPEVTFMFILTKLSLLLVCFSLGGPSPGLAAAVLLPLPFPCAWPLPAALPGAAATAADGRGSSAAGPSWLPRSDCLPLS